MQISFTELIPFQITDYLMAPEITADEVGHLQLLIRDHHISFTQLYPEASVIPKMHYIIHMPCLITK